ncbi:14248_t:CDS:2, partial [Entrophospora sp. SA101]
RLDNNSIDLGYDNSPKDYDKEPSFEELYEKTRDLYNTMKDIREAAKETEESHIPCRMYVENSSDLDCIIKNYKNVWGKRACPLTLSKQTSFVLSYVLVISYCMSAKENWHSEISITAFLNSEYGSYGIPMEIMAYLWKLWHVCGDYGT